MSKYTFGGVAFSSKKAVADHAGAIFRSVALGRSLEGANLEFALDLLARHYEADEKIGCGVASIEVELNAEWGTRSFWLTRVDGSRTDWGVKSCLSPASHEQNVRDAMRYEVRWQIDAFRAAVFAGKRVVCAVSGVMLDPEHTHVDHFDPTFVELARAFLTGRDVASIVLDGQSDGGTFLSLADRSLAAEWHAYHDEHARLRCVTKRVNLSDLRRRHA